MFFYLNQTCPLHLMLKGNAWITNQSDCGIAFQLALRYAFGLTTLPGNTYPDFDGVPGIATHICEYQQ
jgi:hypothetical protein